MEQSRLQPTSSGQRKTLERAVARYESTVTAGAAGWLLDRGIGQEEAVGHRLGVVVDPIPGHEQYEGWLCIPYLARDGHPLTVRFRRPDWEDDSSRAKYKSLPHDPARLYNVGAIHEAGDTVMLTEGEFDSIVLNSLGLPSVAVPGATNWQMRWSKMLAGFSTIFVWADGDKAGAEMAAKLDRVLPGAVTVPVPDGMDVTDVYMTGGEAAIKELLKEAQA